MNTETICVSCMEDDSGSPICPKCGAPFNPTIRNLSLLPPRTMLRDQYLIGRALGHGGFGITYLCWDIGLQARLAIKEYMPTGVANRIDQCRVQPLSENHQQDYEWGLERFMDEARVLKRRNHSNIVSVDTVFRENGTAYLVMEYLEGMTLEEFLRRRGGTVPFEDALRLMLPVTEALSAAHADDVLHRDVSPDNIFITKTGKVKLIDFGAARHSLTQRSQKLTVIYKAGYTPEEQYRQSSVQGPWTDIYATAATFYRTITGKIPFGSLDRLAEDNLESPSHMGIAIPELAEAALMKALSVRGSDRFQNIEEFKRALSGTAAIRNTPITLPVTATQAVPRATVVTSKQPTVSPLEEKIRKYETVAAPPVATQPNEVLPPPVLKQPKPKWPAFVAAGFLVLAAILGFAVWRYMHANAPGRPAGPKDWPAQAANIPQTDAERQKALEAQPQQAETQQEPAPVPPVPFPQPMQPAPQPNSSAPAVAQTTPPPSNTTPAVTSPRPAPLPTPPAPAPAHTASYSDLLNQAHGMVANHQYAEAQTLLNSAVQTNPSDPQAYNELGKIQLYDLNRPSQAFSNYRDAIAKGGQATLRVTVDHSPGWLSITKGKAAFADDSGAHSFPLSDVSEARRNKANLIKIGKGRQEFHIFLANGSKYNLEPTSQDPSAESEFILASIGRQ